MGRKHYAYVARHIAAAMVAVVVKISAYTFDALVAYLAVVVVLRIYVLIFLASCTEAGVILVFADCVHDLLTYGALAIVSYKGVVDRVSADLTVAVVGIIRMGKLYAAFIAAAVTVELVYTGELDPAVVAQTVIIIVEVIYSLSALVAKVVYVGVVMIFLTVEIIYVAADVAQIIAVFVIVVNALSALVASVVFVAVLVLACTHVVVCRIAGVAEVVIVIIKVTHALAAHIAAVVCVGVAV